ncbi:hypothetical protein GDO78_011866 [Eleutherodactylus coqui]|uniref:Uncharacterized protein n=1 Tax=Eleutherodactylus coqui TaxID=57060 RepID=A0A8J6F3X7_ELECQ|nr:hypothetical protein GDO78_011866 [Eleutherodactylus coqui]
MNQLTRSLWEWKLVRTEFFDLLVMFSPIFDFSSQICGGLRARSPPKSRTRASQSKSVEFLQLDRTYVCLTLPAYPICLPVF